jgi:pimeloyl-ACP methyl ester carboxylesterase
MGDAALLLAGYGTDHRRLHPLAERFEAEGVTPVVWPYRPSGTLRSLASALDERARGIAADRLHLVGHSLGGLVCATATLHGSAPIASVTTVNTPWRGTWVSYTGTGPLVEALRWRSDELRELRDDLARHLQRPEGPRWLLASASGDLAVPASSALRVGVRSPRLRRRVVSAKGHSISLLSPRLVAAVARHVVGSHVPAGR